MTTALRRSRSFAALGARVRSPSGRWQVDVAPRGRSSLPASGLGTGWEPAVVLTMVGALLLFGLLTLHSASAVMAERHGNPHFYYILRQASGIAVGVVAMLICAGVPVDWWRRFAPHLMLVSVALLVVVVLPFTHAIAPEINGARRWLRIGITLQPSDLAKIAVVTWTAALLVRKRDRLRSLGRGLAPFLVGWGCIVAPIALEPDYSTALLIVASCPDSDLRRRGASGALRLCRPLRSAGGPSPRLGVPGGRWESILLNPGGSVPESAQQSVPEPGGDGVGGLGGVGFGEGRQKFGFLSRGPQRLHLRDHRRGVGIRGKRRRHPLLPRAGDGRVPRSRATPEPASPSCSPWGSRL